MIHPLLRITFVVGLLIGGTSAFSISQLLPSSASLQNSRLYQSSFAAEGSEYSSKKDGSDFDDDDYASKEGYERTYRDDEDETPTVELQPVPMSKNSGNRFVAFVWDRNLDITGKDALDLHHARTQLTEDHVMFCRKANLYDENFNTDSMVDIVWSLPM